MGIPVLLRSVLYLTITRWFLLLTALLHSSLHRRAPPIQRLLWTFYNKHIRFITWLSQVNR